MCVNLQGTLPCKDDIIRTRNLLLSAEDLRQPMNLNMQLMRSAGLSSDVGKAMAELLLVSHAFSPLFPVPPPPPPSIIPDESGPCEGGLMRRLYWKGFGVCGGRAIAESSSADIQSKTIQGQRSKSFPRLSQGHLSFVEVRA